MSKINTLSTCSFLLREYCPMQLPSTCNICHRHINLIYLPLGEMSNLEPVKVRLELAQSIPRITFVCFCLYGGNENLHRYLKNYGEKERKKEKEQRKHYKSSILKISGCETKSQVFYRFTNIIQTYPSFLPYLPFSVFHTHKYTYTDNCKQ